MEDENQKFVEMMLDKASKKEDVKSEKLTDNVDMLEVEQKLKEIQERLQKTPRN